MFNHGSTASHFTMADEPANTHATLVDLSSLLFAGFDLSSSLDHVTVLALICPSRGLAPMASVNRQLVIRVV